MTAQGTLLRPEQNALAGENHPNKSVALEEAVRQFQNPLLRYARHMLPHRPEEAQDVVQTVFVRYRKAVLNGKPVENPKAWLFRVTHNLSVDTNRRRSRELSYEASTEGHGEALSTEPPENAPGPDAESIQREGHQLVLDELHRLPDEDRQVILMKMFETMTLREIGDVTGTSIAVVHYRLNRGLQALRKRFRELGILDNERVNVPTTCPARSRHES